MIEKITLSIIIPTRNRNDGVIKLLDSITAQDGAKGYEIIVVDNNSHQQKVLKDWCAKKASELTIKYFHETVPGASTARNSGIIQSKGEWLLFLDDDETLPDGYLPSLFKLIENSDSMTIIGGPYNPVFQGPYPSWIKEQYYYIGYGNDERELGKNEWLMSGNLVIHNSLIHHIGYFSVTLGPKGTKLGYGDDTDFLMRAVAIGARQLYSPNIFIYHHIPKERMMVKWFFKSKRHQSWAKALLYTKYLLRDPQYLKRLKIKLHYLRMGIISMFLLSKKLLIGVYKKKGHFDSYKEHFLIEIVLPEYSKTFYYLALFLLYPKSIQVHERTNG